MSLTYSRPDKLNHVDTVLYEIDMLRFATHRLVESKWQEPRDAWVYLEAFLVHYRNLIEFLGKSNPNPRDTDLHVTTIWRQEKLEPPASLKEIHANGAELWKEYEPSDGDGGGRISQYLQHCTTKRVDFKHWRIDTMCERIEPLLAEVEKHLKPTARMLKPMKPAEFGGPFSASTATVTMTAVLPVILDPDLKKRPPR